MPTKQKAAVYGLFDSNYKDCQLIKEITDELSWASWRFTEVHVISLGVGGSKATSRKLSLYY